MRKKRDILGCFSYRISMILFSNSIHRFTWKEGCRYITRPWKKRNAEKNSKVSIWPFTENYKVTLWPSTSVSLSAAKRITIKPHKEAETNLRMPCEMLTVSFPSSSVAFFCLFPPSASRHILGPGTHWLRSKVSFWFWLSNLIGQNLLKYKCSSPSRWPITNWKEEFVSEGLWACASLCAYLFCKNQWIFL